MPRTRSGAPIHRNSLESGTFERHWYRPVSSKDRQKLEVAADIYDRRTKAAGKHGGNVGGARGLKLLSLLLGLQLASPVGQLNPSILWLSSKLAWSSDTVVRKLATLREAGLLDWHKRMKPALQEDAEWRWQQDSNAYRILAPKWLKGALPVVMTPPAMMSEDVEYAGEIAAAAVAEHLQTLGPIDRTEFTAPPEASPLEAAIARFASGFEGRDSRREHDSEIRVQSPPVSLTERIGGVGLTADNSAHKGPPTAGTGATGAACGISGPGQPPTEPPRTG